MTTVNLYTTPDCYQCRLTQRRLTDRNISYRVIKLENEPAIVKKFKAHGIFQAPIVEVLGEEAQIWTGFRPDLIDGLTAEP